MEITILVRGVSVANRYKTSLQSANVFSYVLHPFGVPALPDKLGYFDDQ